MNKWLDRYRKIPDIMIWVDSTHNKPQSKD
jgi:hypothetical protein